MFVVDEAIGALLLQNKKDEASALAEAMLRANSSDLSALNGLAVVRVTEGRIPEAVNLIEQAVGQNPKWALGYYTLGEIARITDNRSGAYRGFHQATECNPTWAQAHYFASVAAAQVGDQANFRAMQEHAREATRLKPEWADAWTQLGKVLQYSSVEQEAETALRTSLSLRPNDVESMYILAVVLMEQDKVEEALPLLEAVVAAAPNHADAARELDRVRGMRKRAAKRDRLARYPRSAKEFEHPEKVFEQYILPEFAELQPMISMSSKVFTLGSCFAANIAKHLALAGVMAEHISMAEEMNSSYANRHLIDWVLGDRSSKPAQRISAVYSGDYGERVANLMKTANVVIYSLGVAPCFFDKETGEFVLTLGENLHAALLAKQFNFRTTSVAENVENIRAIIDGIRGMNPKCHVVLTVSPVPLKATFERPSAILADCVSKSTLRVTAHEIMQLGYENVHYWPAYEVFKWLGPHMGPVFGVDDDSPLHPSDELVKMVISMFLRVFATPDIGSPAAAVSSGG